MRPILFIPCAAMFAALISCSSGPDGSGDRDDSPEQPLFTLVPSGLSNVHFRNAPPENAAMNTFIYEYYYNGGGVAVGDVNKDGLADLFFTSNFGDNKLYLNNGGLEFLDVTAEAGLAGKQGWSTGACMVDIDQDGLMDIYVCRSGMYSETDRRRNELFLNKGLAGGIPVFEESAASFGIDDPAFSTHAAFLDYDRDGDLDIFLLNHNIVVDRFFDFDEIEGTRDPDVGDKLYRNDGKGSFTDVSEQAGVISNSLGYGLGIAVGDLDRDGWPDMYVSNDYLERDYLYLNMRDGTFREVLKQAVGHIPSASMGVDISDINNDGWLDIFVADMIAEDHYGIMTSIAGKPQHMFDTHLEQGFYYQYTSNALQLNRGIHPDKGIPQFSEIARLAGISNTDWSWGPLFADLDNDGDKDFFMANGIRRDFINYDNNINRQKILQKNPSLAEDSRFLEQMISQTPTRAKANCFFRNNGDLSFSKMNQSWDLEVLSMSNGSACADLDNDGDLDIVVNNVDQEAFIYENHARELTENYFLQFSLEGPASNPAGIGARVMIYHGGIHQVREHYMSRGYQSSGQNRLHFGLGKDKGIDSVRVIWPEGKSSLLRDLAGNQFIVLRHCDASGTLESGALGSGADRSPLFKDISQETGLSGVHKENSFDDFGREALLPHRYSRLGPALALADVNGDGMDDFFTGGARGLAGKLWIQSEQGIFTLSSNCPWKLHLESEDVGALFLDVDGDEDMDLYVVSGGNEFRGNVAELQDRLYINDGEGNFAFSEGALPAMLSSGLAVAAADYDRDGDTDLFVGGRIVPGLYPYAPRSYLLRNDSEEGGIRFSDVTEELAPQVMKPGLVTSAVWTDLNKDDYPELVVAGEWMPLMVLKNDGKMLAEASGGKGIPGTSGWWYSLAAGDLDGDGDQDLVAGNLGLNVRYRASRSEPLEVYAGDFDNNGSNDIVLAHYQDGILYPARGLPSMHRQLPHVIQKFRNFHSYASATLEEILGTANMAAAVHLRAETFASSLLLNQGAYNFEIKALPPPAQLSPVNGVIIEDIDRDGNMDILLAGNMFHTESNTPRHDAGCGLFLKGKSKGDFQALSAMESGLMLSGDVKHIELIHLGPGNRPAIISARNGGALQIVRTVQ